MVIRCIFSQLDVNMNLQVTGIRNKFPVIALSFLFTVATVTNSAGQFTNILIDNEGNPEEPSIFINPKNTANLIAGANIDEVYRSTDGGFTWEKDNLESTYGVWGDPCIFTDTAGNFYFIHLSNPPNGNWIDRIVCQKSIDEGASWSNGSYTGLNGTHAQDKAWTAVDPQTNIIYVTWTQFDQYGSSNPNDSSIILFSRSIDGGLTWSTPHRISQLAGDCYDSDNTAEGAVPAVGPDGEVYVGWSNRDTLFFDKSLDGGATWLPNDVVISDQPGGWDYYIPGLQRCNGLPVTRCDLSNSVYHGTIYINWSDQRNGNDNTDIWISKSTDGGASWSVPLKVNDDNLVKQQFLTWMDVDQVTGNVYVLFYDRRNYSDHNTDVYLAYSTDGGNTFTNVKISESPFIPNTSVFFGDYTNLSAYNGKIAPIWARQDGSNTSVWTAIIDIATVINEEPDFTVSHFMLHQNYPNPFSDITAIEMEIKEAGFYSMSLYDLPGKKVASVFVNQFLQTGFHKLTLDPAEYYLHENIYYYSLAGEGESQTKKLVFLR
jgi:hypothetical protein